jgi:N-acetylglucosaminyldiphosphoundecaprenol N-acetyl-beta-D-mannosaminyltransferase
MTAANAEYRLPVGGLAPAAPPTPFPLVVQRELGRPRLDLGRELHCLFGLSFDAITLDEAARQLRRDASEQRPCFVSTPNINFVVAAQSDDAFRKSVLRSDLSLADGMPIVWAARLMGIPIRERVAGSDLFELLCRPSATPLKTYFFGGPDGVAERAARALNAQQGGLRCVCFASPGFGSIADISSPEMIDRINASEADFVVVALGAKKGQAWIEHNRHRLKAPLISHLGAVVNFVAGSVHRAPVLWQRIGMEWLWRVKEEPALWRRYAYDGWALGRLALNRVLPCALAVAWHRLFDRPAPPRHETTSIGGRAVIRLSGAWTREALPPLRREMASWLARDAATVQFDLSAVTWVDSAVLGLLLLIDEWQGEVRAVLPGSAPPPSVRRLFHWHGAEGLLRP